jgi:immunoglobulin-binding protein 1
MEDMDSIQSARRLMKSLCSDRKALDRLASERDLNAINGLLLSLQKAKVGSFRHYEAMLFLTMDAMQSIIESEGCFSANEEADDIKTSDLPLLMVSYAIGEVLATCPSDPSSPSPSSSTAHRLSLVTRALSHYQSFLSLLNSYQLLGELSSVHFAMDEQEGEEESGVRIRKLDPTSKRQEKIDRFKREKAISAQIEQIESRSKPSGNEDEESRDEEEIRRLWFLLVESFSLRSLEQRSFLVEELRILKQHHASVTDSENQLAALSPQERDKRLRQVSEAQRVEQEMRGMVLTGLHKVAASLAQPPGPQASSSSAPSALPLDGKREELMRGVFKPSHTLPTMTVEEYGELEMREMREKQRVQDELAAEALRERNMSVGYGSLSQSRAQREEEKEEEKQRQWDDWKDDNPKGQGNSALRNCGR